VRRFRELTSDEEGFTLLELLAVILIIGILATIAIPSFLNQKSKASDAAAKSLTNTAQIAAEAYATDHDGSYAGLTAALLTQYDATIQTTSAGNNAFVSGVTNVTATGYTITASPVGSGETFITTRSNGLTSRSCTPAGGVHGGCINGTW